MRVLVTGAGGQLGRDVVLAAERAGHTAIPCDRRALDVTEPGAVARALRDHRPSAVVNCAAYTDVDGAETNVDQAMAVNERAAGSMASEAARAGCFLVHVSTDYVFDGARRTPYVESDEPRPLSAYGRSKLAGERAVAAAGGPHAIVRSAWLFGAGGRNFVETMLRLGGERDDVGVVTDQVGCPTWSGHLAPALLEIASRPGKGLYHVAAAGECSWHAFATELFRQAEIDCAVVARSTQDLGRPAPRPAYSVLHSERPDAPRLPAWSDGLAAYLDERALADGPIRPGAPA